jgi:hypothetical protein
VARVEPLRVPAVQPLEACRQLRHGGLEDEVVVVRHQADGVHAPVVLADDDPEEPQKQPAIVVVAVDRDPPGPSSSYVEEAV